MSLIDTYIPCISIGLKDESVLIRKQTLTMLTRLLQVSSVFICMNVLQWKYILFMEFKLK